MARALSNPVYLESPEKGVDGRGVLAKSRAPLMTDGRIGDFWIDLDEGKLYGPKNAAAWPDNGLIRGYKGWTPVFATVIDGARRVQQVIDWQGGEGTKPAAGAYVGSTGLVEDIEDAVDIRGSQGPQQLIDGLTAKSTVATYNTMVALAEAGEENEKSSIRTLFVPTGQLQFKTQASAESDQIPAEVLYVRLLDQGVTRKRVTSEPATGGKHRSADRFLPDGSTSSSNGGWWADDPTSMPYSQDKSSFTLADAGTFAGASIPLYVKSLRVQAFDAAEDISAGAGRWKRVPAEPTHDMKRRSFDRFLPDGSVSSAHGGWWEPDENDLYVEMAGARFGAADNADAINAAGRFLSLRGGGRLKFGAGKYLVGDTIVLYDDVIYDGSGRESTEIEATGNFPVFAHYGSDADILRRTQIQDMMILGSGTDDLSSIGVYVSWSARCIFERLSIRNCRLGYYQDYSYNNHLRVVWSQGCYDGFWWGPLDGALYGVPDNTVFIDQCEAVGTTRWGFRFEGMSGFKATNSVALNGQIGWYAGDPDDAITPNAALGRPTVDAADARVIRFFQMTGCYSDSTTECGFRFKQGGMTSRLSDIKLINGWTGNVLGTTDGIAIDLDGVSHFLMSGSGIVLTGKNLIRGDNCDNVQIDGAILYDYNASASGSDAIYFEDSTNIAINDPSIRPKTGSGSSYGVKFVRVTESSVVGGTIRNAGPVYLTDCLDCVVTGVMQAGSTLPLTEDGTSNRNNITGNRLQVDPVIVGAQTVEALNSGGANPRIGLVGGSAAAPAMFWRGDTDSGLYKVGTSGIAYSFGGAFAWGVMDDAGSARLAAVLPTYADNAAAVAGGLAANRLYKTSAGDVRIRV